MKRIIKGFDRFVMESATAADWKAISATMRGHLGTGGTGLAAMVRQDVDEVAFLDAMRKNVKTQADLTALRNAYGRDDWDEDVAFVTKGPMGAKYSAWLRGLK